MKITTNNFIIALSLLGLALVSGCSKSTPGQAADALAAPTAAGRCIVVDIDITGSYTFTDVALNKTAELILNDARPGDVWYVRAIDNRSYSDRAEILTLRCPAPSTDQVNPFDRAAKASAASRNRNFAKLKSQAASKLREYHHASIRGTDIYGGIAKAGELLSDAPTAQDRILILATDFGDTERNKSPISLANARVFAAYFQSGGSPKAAQRLRKDWSTRFTKWGANQVKFMDPSEGIPDHLPER